MGSALRRVAAAVLAAYGASALPVAAHAAAAVDFAQIDRVLEANHRQMRMPGMAMVIVQGDQIVYRRGVGRADQSGRPLTAGTPMTIASISKPIAATAVMQLAEQGKLALDAPVTRYIPWFRLGSTEGGAGVTVRHLLSQTGGIPQQAGHPLMSDPQIDLEQAARDLPRYGTAGAPGERFVYANSNFAVLGLLVETVAGRTYEQYVREHILEPLGMTQTYFTEAEARAAGMAQGNTASALGISRPVDLRFIPQATPYFQLVSTAEDLARFTVPFLNQGRSGDVQLLSPESVKAMLTAYRPGNPYGLGWWVDTFHGVPAASHGGDAWGFRHELVMLPDQGWAVILLTNENSGRTASMHVSQLAWSVTGMLLDRSGVSRGAWTRVGAGLVMLVLLVLLLAWLALLAAGRARVAQGILGPLAGLWLPGAASVLIGGVILWLGPRWFAQASWAVGLPYHPGSVWAGLGWSVSMLLSGTVHITLPWLSRLLQRG